MVIAFFDFKKHASFYGFQQLGLKVITSNKLEEIASVSTFIRPSEEYLALDHGCWLGTAPTFSDLSTRIYCLLDGQVWMGHDIDQIDIPNLMAEFKKIGEKPPTPRDIIDAVHFTASETELAKAAVHLGLGSTAYGSVESCRKNLEAIMRCGSMMSLFEPDKMRNSDYNDMNPIISLIKSYDDKAQATSSLSKLTL
uniref:Protein NEN3 n=1 Tax=Noccaea caerulescens TaxID=107243 RepID=A0A1J3JMR8_NOCCA